METIKNILYTGPVGVGKTYEAKKKAFEIVTGSNEDFSEAKFSELLNKEDSEIQLISLHSSYSYNDFVAGIQVETNGGNIEYRNVNKIFVNLCNEAKIKRDEKFVLILDDINRVNISEVLGELLFAIENRNESVRTSATLEDGFSVPDNLYIIATMNINSSGVKPDYAVLRRFNIIYINSDEQKLKSALLHKINWENDIKDNQDEKIKSLESVIGKYNSYNEIIEKNISSELNQSDYLIGYTNFLPNTECCIEELEKVVNHKIRHQVLPLLEQYEKEGIIKKGSTLEIATTNTIYTTNYEEVNENKLTPINRITVEEISRLSKTYIFMIVEEIISKNLINQFDIFDLLYNDYDITWNQEMIKVNGELIDRKIKGSLIVLKDDAEKLKMTDDARTPLYSNNANIITYRGKEYLLQSKYDKNLGWNKSNLDEKKAKGIASSGNPFAVIIRLVYKYILRYESNIKGICKEKNSSKDFQYELESITKDLETIREWNVKSQDKKKGEPDKKKDEPDRNTLIKEIYEKIQKLNIWNKDIKGVYKRMDNNYKKVMDMTEVRQMILQGPPGTSKTYGAKEFLCERAGIDNKDGNSTKLRNYQLVDSEDKLGYKLPEESEDKSIFWDIVQFHPSYGYEDFVRGISVSTGPDGGISYKTVNRTLAKMAAIAQDNEKKEFYLIIDEINRANIATVFGELIYALEYRGSAVATPYEIDSKNKLIIPSNMYIIGTMNTADKSIGNIDYAIRRRFLFFPLLPNFKVIKDSIEKNITAEEDYIELKLFYAIEKIFEYYLNTEDYNKDDVQVGHTYFIRKTKEDRKEQTEEVYKKETEEKYKEQMKDRFIYQVIPVLREYYKDNVLSYSDITIDDNKKNDRSIVEDIIKFIMENMVKDYSSDLKELYDTTDEEKKNLISMLKDPKYGEIVEVSYGIVSNHDENKEVSNDGVGSN